MRLFLRDNLKLAIVVACSVLLVLSAPAIGHGVRHAMFAHNADKVDGRHAVGGNAGIAKRKAKLVATKRNGRLPNNIIARAPNADRLDDVDSSALRTISLMPQAAHPGGAAVVNAVGVGLPAGAFGSASMNFVLPTDYAGVAPLSVDVVYSLFNTDACTADISVSSFYGPVGAATYTSVAWPLRGGGTFGPPAGGGTIHRATFTTAGPPHPMEAGQFFRLTLRRFGAEAADTCGSIAVEGMLVSY